MNDEKENTVGGNDDGPVQIESRAYIILHTPKDTGLPVEDQYAVGGEPHKHAHAFGPFFNKAEVESWMNGPDSCTKFVIELNAVRPMAVVGPMDPPPDQRQPLSPGQALGYLFDAIVGGVEATREHEARTRKQRQKDARN